MTRIEEFTNYYTNRRPINESLLNTDEQHGTTSQSVSADEITNNSSPVQENDENSEDIAFSIAEFPDTPSSVAQQTADALGVDIEIDEALPAKGSYNTRTGRIRINPNRHSSPQDIERTILHEVIGHGGYKNKESK